jgi:hypothetical protein
MVFVLGAGIALVNLVSVQVIRIPETSTDQHAAAPSDRIASSAGA